MKNLRVLVVLAVLLGAAAALPAQNLSVWYSIYPNRIEVTFINTGSTPIDASYIIIQDDVLPLAEGTVPVAAYDSEVVVIYCSNANQHTYSVNCEGDPAILRPTEEGFWWGYSTLL